MYFLVCFLQEIASLVQAQSIPHYAAWHTDKVFWEHIDIGYQRQHPTGIILLSLRELRGIRALFAFACGIRALATKYTK